MVRLEKVLERNGTVQEQIQIGDVIIDTARACLEKGFLQDVRHTLWEYFVRMKAP